jgi:protoporphyrinogen oxidase
MKIGIIGGGLTGLVAAYALARDHEIDLFEKMPYLGGCLSSYHINDYWIERYYHHCFSSDTTLFSLLEELGLQDRLEWKNGTTGYYARDKIYPLNTPLQILRYPELTFMDKARLGWLTLTAKKTDIRSLDDIPADQFIIENLGLNVYTSFFEPLLKSKFGERRREVSAAWLFSRIAIRSNRGVEGERLGYLRGGFHNIIDALGSSVVSRGGRILTQTPVTNLTKKSEGWAVNGTSYDAVISTIAPQELERHGGPSLPHIPYQGAACLTLAMNRQVTDGIYWLNMKDPAPYGAIVTHTNFIPMKEYGEHIVYLASYFAGALPQRLDEKMLSDFCSRFSVRMDEIIWHRMAIDPFAGPVYTTGYGSLIPRYEQDGLYMAGMFSKTNYPERSMEGSIRAGFEVAELVRSRGTNERT